MAILLDDLLSVFQLNETITTLEATRRYTAKFASGCDDFSDLMTQAGELLLATNKVDGITGEGWRLSGNHSVTGIINLASELDSDELSQVVQAVTMIWWRKLGVYDGSRGKCHIRN